MSEVPRLTAAAAVTPESEVIVRLCEQELAAFIADPYRNNLGPGMSDPAWESYLLAFAAGNDPLWRGLKTAAGPGHWTPAEAWAAGGVPSATSAGATNAKQPTMSWAALPDAESADGDATQAPAAPADLTVISWAVIQTEATKASNRVETRVPSEPWARARVFGQQANRDLHLALLEALRGAGYDAIAPAMLPAWGELGQGTNGWTTTWSERHVAYVSGLGTFGLSGGLITSRGKAARFGSLIIKAQVAATPRPYSSPFAYCLHFRGQDCAVCVERCPAGSVNVSDRDKTACAQHLNRCEEYVKLHYHFDGYGCGLCQTAVPCESGIPEGLGNSS